LRQSSPRFLWGCPLSGLVASNDATQTTTSEEGLAGQANGSSQRTDAVSSPEFSSPVGNC
jgi:hypothetical protein